MLKRVEAVVFCVAAAAATLSAAPAMAQDDVAAKAQICSVCHGAAGQPIDPKTIPIIFGQQSNYLYKELHDFHSGDRTNAMMSATVKAFTLPDLRQIANFFAAKTWPAKQGDAAATAAPAPDGIDQCRACHQANFEGGQPAPRLSGLTYEYLIAQMNAFADGTRTNNLDMPGFMKALTPGQRDAMARYIAGL